MHLNRIDLAHTVALGSIDDEDLPVVQQLLDSADPVERTEFLMLIQQTREALAALAAATAVAPPARLRDRLMEAISAEQPPVAS